MRKAKREAIARLIVTVLLLLNMALTLAGKNPLPVNESAVADVVTSLLAGMSTAWAWWKNNDITGAAYQGTQYMDRIKKACAEDKRVRSRYGN